MVHSASHGAAGPGDCDPILDGKKKKNGKNAGKKCSEAKAILEPYLSMSTEKNVHFKSDELM